MDDDGDDKDDTKRRTRNLSEKKRRDQFNMLVTELSTLVASNNRKMDKSTVLKSTISFLKNHNELTVRSRAHDVQEDWKPTFLSNEEFTYLVLEALEGFVMVFSASGRIYYASESIMSLLGHNPGDLVNKSIFDLTYEEDRPNLYNILQRNASGMEQIHNTSKENEIIRFQMHLRRGTLDFRDDVSYDLVQFYGHFRINQEQAESEQDMLSYQQDQESRVLFICIGRLHTPQLILGVSLVDSSRGEFTSRHSLEWKFLFLDHRAPPIIGYLPFEVLGTSGYDYYHFDDLEKVVTCHEALMQKGELTSCYYRFLTKGQQWIWLQTRFYITYHQWNSKPEFVVCTHQVVSHAEVAKSAKSIEDQDTVSEAEVVQNNIKETPPDEPMQALSPSFMSESTSEAFGNSFQQLSQKTIKDPPPDDGMPGLSPSYTTESANDAFGNTYQMVSQARMIPLPTSLRRPDTPTYLSDDTKEVLSATCRHMTSPNAVNGSPSDKQVPTLSPSYSLSEGPGDVFGNTYRANSLPTSVKSASGCSTATIATVATTGASWRALKRYTGSDTASLSGDSRDSQRNSEKESHKSSSSILAPQHGIGAQYLDPSPYGAAGVGVPAMLPISTVPVLVTPDQAQMQEQLQRKHEELQQMIVRQQEELRQVKEQLLLARLGILQPLINVPNHYSTPEEIQNQQRMAQLGYANAPPRPDLSGYGPQVPLPPMPPMPLSNMSSHPPQPPRPPHPPHPPRPPHPSNPHQQMPQ